MQSHSAKLRIIYERSKEYFKVIDFEDAAVVDFAAKIIQVTVYYTTLVNIIILLMVG